MEQDHDYSLVSSDPEPDPSDPSPAPVPEPEPVPHPAPEPEPAPVVVESSPEIADQRRRDAAFAAQRRRIDALEAELTRYRQAQVPPSTPEQRPEADPYAPRMEQFQTQEDFIAAQVRYQSQRAMNDYAAQQAWERQQTQWKSQEAEVRHHYPDYDAVVESLETPFHNVVLHTLHQMAEGPALSYWLATHPEEANRLAGLPPAQGLYVLGQMAGQAQAFRGNGNGNGNGTSPPAPAPRQLPAPSVKPAPPTPLGPSSGSTSTVPPDQMDYEDYVRWYEKAHGGRW